MSPHKKTQKTPQKPARKAVARTSVKTAKKPVKSARKTPAPGALRVRPARAGDITQMLALESTVFPSDRISSRQMHYHARNDRAALLVCAEGDRVLGYALLLFRALPDGSTGARLYSIAVDPAAQGQGIGGHLMKAVINAAKAGKCRKISLEVRKKNRRVVGLYEHFGFETLRILPAYYADGGDALRMIRRL